MRRLRLDFDEAAVKWRPGRLHERLAIVSNLLGLGISGVSYFRSGGGNVHVEIGLVDELPDLAVICLQLLLGSDSWRELKNLRRVLDGRRQWNILHGGELLE